MKENEQSINTGGLLSPMDIISMKNICTVGCTTLYHYTSPDGLRGILQPQGNVRLWFTQYDSLNDFSERADILQSIHNYCDLKVKENRISEEFSDTVKELTPSDNCTLTVPGHLPTIINDDGTTSWTHLKTKPCHTYLCCFSEEPDLLPMWNYYTKSQHYEGYSIGLSSSFFQSSVDFGKGFSIELKKVIYSNQEKNALLDRILLPLSDQFLTSAGVVKSEIVQQIQWFIHTFQFVFKNSCFQHEKEIRAILRVPKEPLEDGMILERKYRNSNGYIVPYVDYQCPADAIQKVTTAPLLQQEIAKKNLGDMLKQYGYTNVQIDSSKIPIRF